MKNLRFILFVLILLLGAFVTTASSSMYGGEAVVILPTSKEVSIKQGQMVKAKLYGGGWLSCSRGMDLDYRDAAITHMELWRGGKLVQVIEKRDGRWDTTRQGSNPLCVHVNSPYKSNWYFDNLRFYETGDYELRWRRGISVQLSDGGDYDPDDGYPDLYGPESVDFVVLIHVEGGDWHWDFHH
jgi:hypothetical protein